jgi:hypothetical protein
MPPIEQIFISYKSEYRHLAEKVRDQLQAWGYHVWLDYEQIAKGEYFRHKIDEGLRQSQLVVGIVTREAVLSREVMWEWDYALNNSHFIPLIYDDFDLPYHIRGTQYIDCRGDETHAFAELKQAITHPIERAAPPKLLAEPAKGDERQKMLSMVHQMWIEGVLYPTLRENESLNIPLILAPDKVLHHIDFGNHQLADDADILTIFEDLHRELLILGDPGAGKTILMLQLTEKLISAARADPQQPIPLVFNLSSWAANPKQSLADWLIASLNRLYGVSKKLAETWVKGEKLLLLLDGLDEVAFAYRDTCVDTINTFRRQHQLTDMVVCSRVTDYDALTRHLDLRSGILLQGLTEAQINAYLEDEAYAGVREVMKTDPILQSFAPTPFLLNAIGTAYRGESPASLRLPSSDDPNKARRDDLIGRFVNQHMKAHSSNTYPPAQTGHYLRWLAKNMVARDQIILEVEGLQPDWLSVSQKRVYHVITGVIWGVIWGVMAGVTFGVTFGVIWGVIAGVVKSVIGDVIWGVIEPKEQLQLDLSKENLKGSFSFGVIYVVICVVICVVIGGVIWGVIEGVIWGGIGGVIWGVITGMITGVVKEQTVTTKTVVNQGIKSSLKNGIFLGVGLGVVGGAIGGVGLGVALGVVGGGSVGGGEAVLQHLVLRVLLSLYGYVPMNYARFLTYCAEDLQILRQVGGSFLFRHRTVLEYFADQYHEEDYR